MKSSLFLQIGGALPRADCHCNESTHNRLLHSTATACCGNAFLFGHAQAPCQRRLFPQSAVSCLRLGRLNHNLRSNASLFLVFTSLLASRLAAVGRLLCTLAHLNRDRKTWERRHPAGEKTRNISPARMPALPGFGTSSKQICDRRAPCLAAKALCGKPAKRV